MANLFGKSLAALSLAAALLPFSAAAAVAQNWRVDPQKSTLAFDYIADGVSESGRFRQFRAQGLFDPRRPETTELTLTIDMNSIALSDDFRTSLVKSDTWFDVQSFPKAEFHLTHLRKLDGQRYEAEGDLTIKGRTEPLSLNLDLRIDGDMVYADGEVSFDRMDYHIGDDAAALFVKIDHAVKVRFELAAKRGG